MGGGERLAKLEKGRQEGFHVFVNCDTTSPNVVAWRFHTFHSKKLKQNLAYNRDSNTLQILPTPERFLRSSTHLLTKDWEPRMKAIF